MTVNVGNVTWVLLPVDALTAAALYAERYAHRSGWDQPPILYALKARRTSSAYVLAASEIPFRAALPSGNPADYLRAMADQFGEGHMLNFYAQHHATDAFCGLALVNEVWVRSYTDTDEASEELRTRDLADIPGSFEARSVMMVDVGGRITSCLRRRGEKPFADLDVQGGRIAGSLRDMVLAIALHMPFGSADLDALRAMNIEHARG